LAIFRNLARNISPNYEANETKLGRLLAERSIVLTPSDGFAQSHIWAFDHNIKREI